MYEGGFAVGYAAVVTRELVGLLVNSQKGSWRCFGHPVSNNIYAQAFGPIWLYPRCILLLFVRLLVMRFVCSCVPALIGA